MIIFDAIANFFAQKFLRPQITPFDAQTEKEKGKGFYYKNQEYIHYSDLSPNQSTFHRLSGTQILFFICIVELLVVAFILDWHLGVIFVIAFLTFVYFSDLLFNLYLVYRSISKPSETQLTDADLAHARDFAWPTYTILCPLYKEGHVVPQFVQAMSALDYPKEKLQIMLLLEEDDSETINEVRALRLPSHFEIVVVPHSLPKTKPKACNYGLSLAKGEYIVIYDAEDIPDAQQLRKAVLAFRTLGEKTVCVQAKLNFYNPHQNLLTKIFTAEYSLWFDLVLTGLQSIHAPIPLGGTSNHFRTKDLRLLKGWDSFNVTEDCDLGMRLVKQGYQTSVIDSTTLEEANSNMKNWFWQRTRWIKGYMQTYLLHMRNPKDFMKSWTQPHIITFQLVVGGKVMSMFINPLMWILTICYFLFRAHVATFIEPFFPTPILYMGVFSLLVGNFLYMYYYMVGCAKHGHYNLIKYVLFVPFYWLAMSLAAWIAVYKLFVAPHQWSKTKHGLHLKNKEFVQPLAIAYNAPEQEKTDEYSQIPSVSICIPAYNEEKNIASILKALLEQETKTVHIEDIVVVSSASTDHTNSIVEEFMAISPMVRLIRQEKRQGKAEAINAFLKKYHGGLIVIESADTIPEKDCIEKLCLPLVKDTTIGMTGGAPHPVNDPNTFLGYIVHAWWWFHRNIPRFGEVIAYRNVLEEISPTTSVDEAYIQARMARMGYRIVHVDEAIVHNKGAENLVDLIKQRRRVMNGHVRLHKDQGIKIDNMTKSSIVLLLFKYKFKNLKQVIWFLAGMGIEIYSRILGWYDFSIKGENPFVWEVASSTKNLSKSSI